MLNHSKIKKILFILCIIGCLFGFQNCSPSMNFSEQQDSSSTVTKDGADSSPSPTSTTTSTTPTPSPSPSPSPSPAMPPCGESGITNARVISGDTWNGQANNYIDFEVSLASCDGKEVALTNQPILFDVNAFSPGNYSLNYQVNDGVSPLQSGELAYSAGEDLFNNVGPNYGHWTTATLSFATSVKTVNIRIYLMGKSYFPNEPQYRGVTTVTQDYVIDTYLKFGNALPVTAKVVFKKP
ncbi:MAG: hypothetical protein ACM3MG_11825 [Bacillota bacterium]